MTVFNLKRSQDSAERMGQVISEQALRLQELRGVVASAGSASRGTSDHAPDTQNLREELRLVLARQREAQGEVSSLRSTLAISQDQLQAQASELEALNRTVSIKDELIKVCAVLYLFFSVTAFYCLFNFFTCFSGSADAAGRALRSSAGGETNTGTAGA